MKKLLGLAITTLVLVGTLSTPSLADGGAPFPLCAPWQCVADSTQLSK
jgi:hypothetical protein